MKVIEWIGDMNWNSSLGHCRLASKFIVEKPGGFQSARIILCGLGFGETEPNEVVGVLPGREQK